MAPKRLRWKMWVLDENLASRVHALMVQRAAAVPILAPDAIPSEEQLGTLLSEIFWASLQKMEGRETRLAVQFGPIGSGRDAMRFGSPFAFSASTLVRLAPALESRTRAAWVHQANDRGLVVWGASGKDLGHLRIEAFDPAVISVRFAGRNLFFSRGGASEVLEEADYWQLVGFLAEALDGHIPGDPNQIFVSSIPILHIVREMLGQQLGGIIAVVPEDSGDLAKVLDMTYQSVPTFTTLTEQMTKYAPEGQWMVPPPRSASDFNPIPSEMDSTIEMLGQMTAVDGALILRKNLEVVGFGAFIHSGADDPELELHEAGNLSEPPRRLRLSDIAAGARHRAGANLCLLQPGSVSFVASQDGSLTVFFKRGESLIALTHAELYLI